MPLVTGSHTPSRKVMNIESILLMMCKESSTDVALENFSKMTFFQIEYQKTEITEKIRIWLIQKKNMDGCTHQLTPFSSNLGVTLF